MNPFFLPQKYQGKCKAPDTFNKFVEQMYTGAKTVHSVGFWSVLA